MSKYYKITYLSTSSLLFKSMTRNIIIDLFKIIITMYYLIKWYCIIIYQSRHIERNFGIRQWEVYHTIIKYSVNSYSRLDTPNLVRSIQIWPLLSAFYSSKLLQYVFRLPTWHTSNRVHYQIKKWGKIEVYKIHS